MRPINAIDSNITELPRGMTAGALLSEALWSSSRVRQLEFAITTRHDGSLVLCDGAGAGSLWAEICAQEVPRRREQVRGVRHGLGLRV